MFLALFKPINDAINKLLFIKLFQKYLLIESYSSIEMYKHRFCLQVNIIV